MFHLFFEAALFVCHAAVVSSLSGLHYCAWQQVLLSRLNVCHSSCFQIPEMMAMVVNIVHYQKKKKRTKEKNIVKEKNKL